MITMKIGRCPYCNEYLSKDDIEFKTVDYGWEIYMRFSICKHCEKILGLTKM